MSSSAKRAHEGGDDHEQRRVQLNALMCQGRIQTCSASPTDGSEGLVGGAVVPAAVPAAASAAASALGVPAVPTVPTSPLNSLFPSASASAGGASSSIDPGPGPAVGASSTSASSSSPSASSSSSSSSSATKNILTVMLSFGEGPLGLTLSNADDAEQVRLHRGGVALPMNPLPFHRTYFVPHARRKCFVSNVSAHSLRSFSPLPRSAPLLTPPLPLVRRALHTLDALLTRSPHSLRHAQGDASMSPVVIEEVAAGSQAATLGVQRGDHISTVEGSTAFADVGSVIVLVKAQTRPVKVSIIA